MATRNARLIALEQASAKAKFESLPLSHFYGDSRGPATSADGLIRPLSLAEFYELFELSSNEHTEKPRSFP